MALTVNRKDGNFWCVGINLTSTCERDTFYLSCSENCFSEGNLKFERRGVERSIEITTGFGKFSYMILKNQYTRIDGNGKEVRNRRSILFDPEGIIHEIGGREFIYQNSGISQLVFIHGKECKSEISFKDGLILIRKDMNVPYGVYFADVYFVKGYGDYSINSEGKVKIYSLSSSASHNSGGTGIIYHIFPDRFYRRGQKLQNLQKFGTRPGRGDFYGGNIKGIIEKLDYIHSLNVEYLYLNPLFKSRSNHRYDVDDYFEVDSLLGSKRDLKALVKECHNRGIKVILDMVFNHTSVFFPPFQDVLENGRKSKYFDWYIFHRDEYKIFNGHYDQKKGSEPPAYETFMGYGLMPKLNTYNAEVIDFLKKVVAYYVTEFDIDGFRYDVGHSIPESLIEKLKVHTAALKKDILHVGEAWCLSRSLVKSDYYDSLTNYHIRKSIIDYVKGKDSIEEFYSHYLEEIVTYSNSIDNMMNILDSHDTVRILTTLQSDEEKMRIAYLILLMLNGKPTIYYGDEVGLLGNRDPDCRRTFPWERIGSEINKFFISITGLRERLPEMRSGLLYVKKVHGHDMLVKMGPEYSVALLIQGKNEVKSNIDEVLPSAEILFQGNTFVLFVMPSENLIEFENSLTR